MEEELKIALKEAENQIAVERVAGNIVKEEFWKGQTSGIRIALAVIHVSGEGAVKKTKKAFREYLNEKFKDTKRYKNYRYHQRKRLYGDYLYAQDLDMFNCCYERWLKGEY